jgi:magnesium transporter
MTIVDNAVYVDGARVDSPTSLDNTYRTMRRLDGMAWIGLYRPDAAEVESLAREFDLHHLAVEDTIAAHQRPRLEATPELLCLGPEAILYAILDQVVDEYLPVAAGLENDIDEIENQVFTGDPAVARRIYDLSGEVIDFQRATHPLVSMLEALERGSDKYHVDVELRRHLRDVLDHTIRVIERADSSRAHLQTALTVHATLVAQKQNEEMQRLTMTSLAQNEEVKKISAWAAILFAPTLVGTVYGMNFEDIPELSWQFGYPMAVLLMVATSVTLFFVFKRQHWL